ncbi:MAG: type II secretion system F family protein [Melioribacteraceae bacterium]|nr:type II secretion system F family protein [Melioribacteraceae bacterium]MCF8263760.1 type II secretion system F family protein [Melioribacteraceae bacterium]MCF8412786.1 type II secretion system F family protein [Melioribacteraceae bacterium]MCF8430633.1 type II secretion system F family protein [Melioribacteraceae bacterium]
MIELRFQAIKQSGQAITGTINVPSYSEGKKKIKLIAEKYLLSVRKVERKYTYRYKVTRGNEKPITGEQKAFSKEEVNIALRKLGFKIISVNKLFFELNIKPPQHEILSFVKISAELLEQKLSFGEILNLLMSDTKNKTLKEVLKQINSELKQGGDSEKVFLKYQKIFGKFTAYMLGLASKSGNMVEIYKATAKFLERRQQFRKDLKSALITPFVTLFIMFLAVLFYISYIFPETAQLFVKLGVKLPPMTDVTLKMSYFISDYIVFILAGMFAPVAAVLFYFSTEKGKLFRDKMILRIPVVGSLIHKTLIEVFCRVFYTIYSGSSNSIEPIAIAAESTGNKYFENQIKTISIPAMLQKGSGLTESFKASGVFTDTALARFHSGEETGTIKNTLKQVANYYESETVFRLKNIIEIIQVTISMIIMVVMVALTLVSAETATISPNSPMSK